jgi:branched-subunit amino acid ABC-type transport system permease component
VLLITVLLLAAATLVMRYTRLGLAFRASSWSPEIAAAYGVNVGLVRFCSAAAAAALAGLAGVFAAVLAGSVSPFLGSAAGLKGIVAMLIGGAGNLPGAVIGGLSIGVIEALSGQVVSGSTSQVVSYAVLFLVMVARPSGLMKER